MKPGDEVLCPCGEWVSVEQGINALVAEKGHRYHFYSVQARIRKLGNLSTLDEGGRTHHLVEGFDVIRSAA